MITLTTLLIIFLALVVATVICVIAGGVTGLLIFGDVIVAVLIIGFIVKLIIK